jgi:hypothetical protein
VACGAWRLAEAMPASNAPKDSPSTNRVALNRPISSSRPKS